MVRKTYRNSVILITKCPGSQLRVPLCQLYSRHIFQVPPHIEQVLFTLWSNNLIVVCQSCDQGVWIMLVFYNACCKLILYNTSSTHIWQNICPFDYLCGFRWWKIAYPATKPRQNQYWFHVPGTPKTKFNVVEFIVVPMFSIATNPSQLINVYR